MEIRQLRYFAAVAEQNSFSKAAEKTYVAQSALSHQIAQLEAELGVKLFHRNNRGTTLTEAGETFFTYAVSILKQLDDAQLSVQGPFSVPKGKVSLGLPPSACNALAVPLLQAVRAELPGIELELTEEATGRLSDQLKQGLLNMAVLFDDGRLDELVVQSLVDERLYLLCKAEEGKKGYGPAITLRETLERPLFLASAKQGVRRIIEQAAKKNNLRQPNVVADINSVSILRSTVLAGLGCTILPPMALKNELDSGQIYGRPISTPRLKRRVVLCRPKSIPATPAAQAVTALTIRLAQHLSKTRAWIETSAPLV